LYTIFSRQIAGYPQKMLPGLIIKLQLNEENYL